MKIKYDKWIILSLFLASFLFKGLYACLFVLSLLGLLLIYEKKLFKHLANTGFLIFFLITVLVPAIMFQKITENILIVSRGIVFIFTCYFLFKDIESSKLYPHLQKIIPEELKTSINIAFKLLPDIKTVFTKSWEKIKQGKRLSIDALIELFSSLSQLAEQFEDDAIKPDPGKVYIITGKVHEGKSSLALKIADKLKKKDFKVGGIISKSTNHDGKRIGYEVIDLKTGKSLPLATINKPDSYSEVCGPFYFYKEGMEFALNSLSLDYLEDDEIVFIDEAGKLELNEKGFFSSINQLLDFKKHTVVLVIRDEYIDAATKKFNFEPNHIIRVNKI